MEMFRNGFRLDGGAFRPTSGADATDGNRAFLRALAKREVPRELETEEGGDVDLRVVDRRAEEFSGPAGGAAAATSPPRERFEGEGRALGGADEAGVGSDAASGRVGEAVAIEVDSGRPTLTMAVRLASGKRSRVTVNETHTVGELAAHVRTLCDCGGRPFALYAGYPPSALEDPAATVMEAGLKGASVQQKPL